MQSTAEQLASEVTKLKTKLADKDAQIAELERLVDYLRRKPFKSPSDMYEGLVPLFNESEETAASAKPSEKKSKVQSHERARPVRRPLPLNLPREFVRHELSQEAQICECGCRLHEIGAEKSEQLHIIPAKMTVRVHERVKYGCRGCEGKVITAPMPKQPIPKSMATPSTLAHIVISKYADALPLYRQEAIWERAGIDLDRGTMASWIIKLGDLVKPVLNLMREDMLREGVVHCDETTVKVIDQNRLKQKTKKSVTPGYMWVLSRAGPGPAAHIFEYDPSRAGGVVERLLSGFRGTVVTDGYDGYNRLQKLGITRAGCFAHVRRKFVEAIDIEGRETGASVAHRMMTLIRRLYRVERYIADKADDFKLTTRRRVSSKIMGVIEKTLDLNINRVPPKTPTGKALRYLANEWGTLQVFLANPRVPIDNNRVENAIRPFTLGRKNWLFSATTPGAHASAALYSLIETAKANGLEPQGYLERLFTNLPNATTLDQIEKLLPYPASH